MTEFEASFQNARGQFFLLEGRSYHYLPTSYSWQWGVVSDCLLRLRANTWASWIVVHDVQTLITLGSVPNAKRRRERTWSGALPGCLH